MKHFAFFFFCVPSQVSLEKYQSRIPTIPLARCTGRDLIDLRENHKISVANDAVNMNKKFSDEIVYGVSECGGMHKTTDGHERHKQATKTPDQRTY